MKITLSDWVSKFNSVEVESSEFKRVVKEFLEDLYPNRKIKSFEVDNNGISVILDDEERVEIEVDWNEFIIK
jgi:hypothetical protein